LKEKKAAEVMKKVLSKPKMFSLKRETGKITQISSKTFMGATDLETERNEY